MLKGNYSLLYVLVSCIILTASCNLANERPPSGPIQLSKPVRSPGVYAYRSFHAGPFPNVVEVFDLQSRESIGKLVPTSEKVRITGFALAPREPKGILTLFGHRGIVYFFDLQKSEWNSLLDESATLGYVVPVSPKHRAWLNNVRAPDIVEVDLNLRELIRRINLSSYFQQALPYMAISPDFRYLAVLGNSGADVQNRRNLNSLLLVELESSEVKSVFPLGNYPVNPTFSFDGRFVCTQSWLEKRILVIDLVDNTTTVLTPPIGSEIAPTHDFFSIAMHPSENILVASLYDLSNPEKDPLDLLVLFDLDRRSASSVLRVQTIVSELSFRPDGSVLYAATPVGLAALDGKTFEVLYEISSALQGSNVGSRSPHTLPGGLLIQDLR